MIESRHSIGVGATSELRLRVSVAALARVLLRESNDSRTMLALERTATLREIDGKRTVIVMAKPFGGGVRILDPNALRELIGDFRYDSDRSREEQDFRVYVHPDAWETVRAICRERLEGRHSAILETSPDRELAEEFEDALGLSIKRDAYQVKSRGIMVDDMPSATRSVRATGAPTVRVYFVFEVWIEDAGVVRRILDNARRYTNADLDRIARRDAALGGRGRANGILVVDLQGLQDAYRSLPSGRRGEPIRFSGHQLDGNVLAILDEVEQARYERYVPSAQ